MFSGFGCNSESRGGGVGGRPKSEVIAGGVVGNSGGEFGSERFMIWDLVLVKFQSM